MNKFEKWFGSHIVRFRWPVIIVLFLFTLWAASGLRFLSFSNDSRMFFSEENPQLQALEALEQTYNKVENILIVIAPQSGNVFERQTLAAIEEITESAWQIPYSSRVDSITNFQYTRAEEDDLIVEDMILDAMALTDEEIAAARKTVLLEPLLLSSLISPSAHVTGINVNIIKPEKDRNEANEAALAGRKIQQEIEEKYPFLDVYLTGSIMIDTAFGEASQKDIKSLVPLMFVVLLVSLFVFLRSFLGMCVTFLVIVMSMLTGLGLAGWLGMELTPASANAPVIILTLAVADSIHLLSSMFLQMRQGKENHTAIPEAVRVNLQPVFVTSLTTSIGFLTMNFSDAPPFRDLGNIVAMGVMAAFVFSVFFLPALMAVLPVRIKKAQKHQTPFFDRFADFIIDRQTQVFWLMLLAILIFTSGVRQIELNDDFIKYFDSSYDFRVATDFTAENLTGMEIIDWELKSGEEGGINNPDFLAQVESFTTWLREQPNVYHVYSITDIMKRLNRNMHGDDDSCYRLPEERELAAQYLLLYEMSLPFGLDLNDRINVDKSAIRLTVTLPNKGTMAVQDLEARGRQWLVDNAPEMAAHGSGLSVIFAHISERNIRSMLSASVLALALISLIMIIVLRDIRLGVLSLLPNLAPAFMAFGVWGMVVGQVGLAVSVMIAMTLGIVVDDTVHFLSKYQRARREYQMTAEEAVRFSFNTVGLPIWITTVSLISGFSILAFSGFQINSHMGSMTSLTIAFALLLDFFFLPALLMKLEGK